MIPGYGAVKDRMSAEEYYQGVVDGRIKDSTLSMQLGVGFEPRALLANYLNDPVCDNYSVLLVLGADKDVRGASRKHAMSYIRLNTEIPGPRARRSDRPPRGRGARRPRAARPTWSSSAPTARSSSTWTATR